MFAAAQANGVHVFIHTQTGGVKVNDPRIRPEWVRQQVGMVFQSFNLFTHLNALENVMIGLRKVKRMDRA